MKQIYQAKVTVRGRAPAGGSGPLTVLTFHFSTPLALEDFTREAIRLGAVVSTNTLAIYDDAERPLAAVSREAGR